MKIENQVCSHQQGERLHELGVVKNKSHFQWMQVVVNDTKKIWALFRPNSGAYDWMCDEGLPDELGGEDFETDKECSAFTVAELGVMLPHFDNLSQMGGFVHLTEFDPSVQDGNPWYCVWEYDKDKENAGFGREIIDGETEAQARAAMLIYCLERQLTTAEEVNQRLTNP